jgi:hypothetical protein
MALRCGRPRRWQLTDRPDSEQFRSIPKDAGGVWLWQRGVAVEQQGIATAERDKATQNFQIAKHRPIEWWSTWPGGCAMCRV